uniref:Uncharacterized protein n=1 Tax=Panagrolaimus superbus TaxID=310955 RepID=A0A914Y140_9BILA
MWKYRSNSYSYAAAQCPVCSKKTMDMDHAGEYGAFTYAALFFCKRTCTARNIQLKDILTLKMNNNWMLGMLETVIHFDVCLSCKKAHDDEIHGDIIKVDLCKLCVKAKNNGCFETYKCRTNGVGDRNYKEMPSKNSKHTITYKVNCSDCKNANFSNDKKCSPPDAYGRVKVYIILCEKCRGGNKLAEKASDDAYNFDYSCGAFSCNGREMAKKESEITYQKKDVLKRKFQDNDEEMKGL